MLYVDKKIDALTLDLSMSKPTHHAPLQRGTEFNLLDSSEIDPMYVIKFSFDIETALHEFLGNSDIKALKKQTP